MAENPENFQERLYNISNKDSMKELDKELERKLEQESKYEYDSR